MKSLGIVLVGLLGLLVLGFSIATAFPNNMGFGMPWMAVPGMGNGMMGNGMMGNGMPCPMMNNMGPMNQGMMSMDCVDMNLMQQECMEHMHQHMGLEDHEEDNH